jgi:hypothetical protein
MKANPFGDNPMTARIEPAFFNRTFALVIFIFGVDVVGVSSEQSRGDTAPSEDRICCGKLLLEYLNLP